MLRIINNKDEFTIKRTECDSRLALTESGVFIYYTEEDFGESSKMRELSGLTNDEFNLCVLSNMCEALMNNGKFALDILCNERCVDAVLSKFYESSGREFSEGTCKLSISHGIPLKEIKSEFHATSDGKRLCKLCYTEDSVMISEEDNRYIDFSSLVINKRELVNLYCSIILLATSSKSLYGKVDYINLYNNLKSKVVMGV